MTYWRKAKIVSLLVMQAIESKLHKKLFFFVKGLRMPKASGNERAALNHLMKKAP